MSDQQFTAGFIILTIGWFFMLCFFADITDKTKKSFVIIDSENSVITVRRGSTGKTVKLLSDDFWTRVGLGD